MALPPALLARLSKRGIVSTNNSPTPGSLNQDPIHGTVAPNSKGAGGGFGSIAFLESVALCVNKYNVYHECTSWCHVTWKGYASLDPKMARRSKRMLEKYPLPKNWVEVFDRGIGRNYYWDVDSQLVSWLPPKHPAAKIGEAAQTIRMRLHRDRTIGTGQHLQQRGGIGHYRQSVGGAARHPDNEEEFSSGGSSTGRPRSRYDTAQRDRRNSSGDKRRASPERRSYSDRREPMSSGERHRNKRPRSKSNDILDPMDPAAYSDVPRGTWSDGLDDRSGKADSSAGGSTYQQRPYPSPREVLASNKARK